MPTCRARSPQSERATRRQLSSRRGLIATVLVAILVLLGVLLLVRIPLGRPSESSIVVGGSPLLNKPAPEFDLVRLDGSRARLSDYRGRPVIVNFWASWCIPCRDEFPQFVAARREYAADGLEILGVVHDDSADAASAFATANHATWPLLLDPDDVAWKAYLGGVGVPMTFFIDRDGVVRATSFGPVTPTGFPEQVGTIL